MDYYRRFPGDYARDTKHLNLDQHGAYNLLLDHLYSTESAISSVQAAVKICGATSKRDQNAVKFVLANFFERHEEGYRHKRVDEELSYAESKRRQASYAGKQSAKVRTDVQRTFNGRSTIPDNQTARQPETSNSTTEREALADWIPLSLWSDYRTMREKMKRPLTSGAVDILVEDLRKLRDAGEDVSEVLKQAIAGGWFAFRAIRKEKVNGTIESFEERRQRKSAEAIGAVRGRVDEVLRKVEPTPRLESGEQTTDSRLRRGPN